MSELIEATRTSFKDRLADPQVGLGEILTEAGLEGLTPDERLGLIEQATVEDYMNAADIIHRKVAPEHSHEPHPDPVKIVNPHTGEVSHYMAAPSEREGILNKALENAKKIVAKYRIEGGSPEDALQRCGNLAAFGLALAHIYEEGNGRMARTVGEIIHQGYDSQNPESVENLAVVSKNRPTDGSFRINSYVPTGEWSGRANTQPHDFLDMVAGFDAPFDGQSYQDYVRGSFTTPRM